MSACENGQLPSGLCRALMCSSLNELNAVLNGALGAVCSPRFQCRRGWIRSLRARCEQQFHNGCVATHPGEVKGPSAKSDIRRCEAKPSPPPTATDMAA